MIKAVIFDHDGVIADLEPLHAEADNLVLARYGAHFPDDKMAGLIGVSTLKSWEIFKELFKIPEAAEWLAEEKTGVVVRLIEKDGIAPSEGLLPLLKLLKEKGYKLAIASGQYRRVIDAVITQLKLGQYFDAIASCDDVTRGKPDPAVFLLAAKKLGTEPAECLVIEDSAPGIAAAKAAGMACVALRTPSTASHDISMADVAIDSLSELTTEQVNAINENNKNRTTGQNA